MLFADIGNSRFDVILVCIKVFDSKGNEFCNFIEGLPYSEIITFENKERKQRDKEKRQYEKLLQAAISAMNPVPVDNKEKEKTDAEN